VERKQSGASHQDLRRLRPPDELAPRLGKKLGRGEILFGCLPAPQREIMTQPLRHLVLVLGDQLDPAASAFDDFDPQHDALWMAEVSDESTHVPSSKLRTALFLSAMRHFAAECRTRGWTVHYTPLEAGVATLGEALAADIARLRPQRLILTAPGEWRVLQTLRRAARDLGVPLELRDDRHFFTTVRDFAAYARGRRQLRMEYFYRALRERHRVLMEGDPKSGSYPVG
jgi:deoxyribodipyrimidine photolyase-related protein